MTQYILSIDQGTTSTRAILFNREGKPIFTAQEEFEQHFPGNGWVEHNPEDIWSSTVSVCKKVLANVDAKEVVGLGITNQRETTLVWDKHTGEPVTRAIVWQDRRTANYCLELKKRGIESTINQKTGLLLDPYFSGTKLHWILENVTGAREKAERGELLFGTVDSFLLWRLTGGKSHYTDATNASRTLLFNINTQQWDDELLELFGVPKTMLPEVLDCSADFGVTDPSIFGTALPIGGMAGDQQAALFGQACYESGMVKSTYGTGCFMIVNTGSQAVFSKHKLLTTVAYRLNGKTTYALEGSIFMAGATMQWLRDGIGLLTNAKESSSMADSVGDDQSVYLVPAFTGLGAPYWNPEARGALIGMTRNTGPKEIVTAGLQSVGYQTRDLVDAMKKDGVNQLKAVRVDGGMVVNDWAMQFLSDIVNLRVDRPLVTETTALGAALLAGMQFGFYGSLTEVAAIWQCEKEFPASMPAMKRERLYQGWQRAVAGVEAVAH